MSDFNYYYTSGYKGRGSDILEALRQKDDQTKAEAIDFLIDRGYLHSEEMYNAAYVNAMGDYLGISDYDPDEYDEYNAPVGRGTKHSALDEVHQRLREAGKKRRQQRIAQARRMKKERFDAEGIVKMKIEYEWFCDFYDEEENKLYKDYGGLSKDDRMKIEYYVQKEIESHIASGELEGYYPYSDIGWSNDEGSYEVGYAFALISGNPAVIFEGHHGHHHAAEMEMTPDIMDYPGLPVVPDSYGTNSALDSGNGVPQWYGSAETFDSSDDRMMMKNVRLRIDEEGTTPTWAIEKKIPVLYHYDDSSDLEGIVEDIGDVAERYAKEHNDAYRFGAETFEAPFAGAGSLFKFGGNDSALGGFTAKELTESSAIHGDFDHAALNYSGHQNIEARAEGDGEVSERVYIRFSWETPSEYDRIIDEYTITDAVYDEVYQEVQSGNYSGVGSYTYYYDQEDDDGNTEESELEVEYEWG